MKLNGQLMRPLVVIGAAALAALFLLGLAAIGEALFGVHTSEFVRLVIVLAGIVGGGAAGASYVKRASDD